MWCPVSLSYLMVFHALLFLNFVKLAVGTDQECARCRLNYEHCMSFCAGDTQRAKCRMKCSHAPCFSNCSSESTTAPSPFLHERQVDNSAGVESEQEEERDMWPLWVSIGVVAAVVVLITASVLFLFCSSTKRRRRSRKKCKYYWSFIRLVRERQYKRQKRKRPKPTEAEIQTQELGTTQRSATKGSVRCSSCSANQSVTARVESSILSNQNHYGADELVTAEKEEQSDSDHIFQ